MTRTILSIFLLVACCFVQATSSITGKGYMTIAGLDVPWCEYESCYNGDQCDNSPARRKPSFTQDTYANFPCFCDYYCLMYGDCCFDYYQTCLGIDIYQAAANLTDILMSLGNLTVNVADDQLRMLIDKNCRKVEVVSGVHHYWFVARCPGDADMSEEDINMCESNNKTLFSQVPVTLKENPSITFWNVHCALCHGLQKKDVRFWQTRLLCRNLTKVPDSYINIEYFIENGSCTLEVEKNDIDKPRPCTQSFQKEPTLPSPSLNPQQTGRTTKSRNTFQKLCSHYIYPVKDPGNNIYKNAHCAYQINGPVMTNFPFRCTWNFTKQFFHKDTNAGTITFYPTPAYELTWPMYLSRSTTPPAGVGTFSIMFNFGDDGVTLRTKDRVVSVKTTVCPRVNEVFLPYSEKCVRLHCDERDRRPVNGTCRLKDKVIVNGTKQPYPHGVDIFVVSLRVQGQKSRMKQVMRRHLQLCEKTLFNYNDNSHNNIKLKITVKNLSQFSVKHNTSECPDRDITFSYNIFVHFSVALRTIYMRLLDTFTTLSRNLNRFNISITQLHLQNFKIPNKHVENALSEYNDVISSSNVSVCPDGNIHRYFQDVEIVLDKNDLYAKINVSYFRLDNVVFQVTVEERQYVRNVTDVIVCYPYQDNTTLHCPNGSVPVERDDYRLENGSLFIIHKGLRLGPGNFSIRDDVIYVCSTYKREHKVYHVIFFNYNNIQDVLTIVTSSVSMSSLLVLLFVYSLLPEMRNIPGKIVMSLSTTLLLAQSFQLLIKVPTGWLCTVVASLVHTMWLSTFMWMTMLSVDLVRSLRSMSPVAGIRSHSKLFWLYAGLAWILPLVFVMVCVLVDHFHIWDIVIGYGSDRLCWITNLNACLFIFGIPIILTLVVNGICFILTSVEIEKTTSKVATNSKSCKNESTRLGIYVRLSLIMGFSWIFCFVAAFTQIEQLWYFPIVLDGLHGFYICACFVFKPRVRKMLMVKFGFQPKKGNMKESVITITTKS